MGRSIALSIVCFLSFCVDQSLATCNPSALQLLVEGIRYPLPFCSWYTSIGYSSASPFPSISEPILYQLCECVDSNPSSLKSVKVNFAPVSSSSIGSVDTLDNLIKLPYSFCIYWESSQGRAGSPFTQLESSALYDVCSQVLARHTEPALVVTVTKIHTITPSSFVHTRLDTSTVWITVTGKTQYFDSYVTTSTSTLTATATRELDATSVKTSTLTITSIPTTVTLPAQDGFTALGDQIKSAGDSYSKKKKRLAELGARAVDRPDSLDQIAKRAVASTVTKTATITLIPVTVTKIKTTITTLTVVSTPISAYTTITDIETITRDIRTVDVHSTITDIVTLSSTTIEPTPTPQPTFYAACAANNLVSTLDGNTFDSFGQTSSGISNPAAESAYDCCVLCILSDTCAAMAFYTPFALCTLLNFETTCSPDQIITYLDINEGTSEGYTVSNGNCGKWGFDQ